jgi:hypothetical protein
MRQRFCSQSISEEKNFTLKAKIFPAIYKIYLLFNFSITKHSVDSFCLQAYTPKENILLSCLYRTGFVGRFVSHKTACRLTRSSYFKYELNRFFGGKKNEKDSRIYFDFGFYSGCGERGGLLVAQRAAAKSMYEKLHGAASRLPTGGERESQPMSASV